MAISSINSSLSSLAVLGLHQASSRLETATARLSSGNRLQRASDDVAALSISTRLQSNLVAMRQAIQNTAQASSMLQVAYEGLNNSRDVLDRMLAIATQSNSGSTTDAQRAFLQVEFEELTSELDRIANNTTFNKINLLDGSITGENNIDTNSAVASQATGTLNFSVLATTETVILNGVTLTADTEFAVGATLSDTLDNLVTYLNTSASAASALKSATYSHASGSSVLNISYNSGGKLGSLYTIDQANSTATFTTVGDVTSIANVYALTGGADNGLYYGSTTVSGTPGGSLVNTQSQVKANTVLTFTGNAVAGNTIVLDDGNGGNITFTYAATAVAATDITVGADAEESIQNAIGAIMAYTEANTNNDTYGLRQLEFERGTNTLTIRNKVAGNPLDLAAAALNVSETLANASFSTTTLNNGVNTGINASGITNKDFVGTISGFTATRTGPDAVTASITVGSSTYTAKITDTTPAADTFVRFSSSNGGFFDVQLNGGTGTTVADQDGADTWAARLDQAFSTMTFSQNRKASSFTGSGDFAGAKLNFQNTDFSNTNIDSVDFIAPSMVGGDAIGVISINDEAYINTKLGSAIGPYETVKFYNVTDSNKFIELTNGGTSVDLSSGSAAATAATQLKTSLGMGVDGSGSLSFQIGSSSTDTLQVSINSARSSKLFGGNSPAVSSQGDAEDAIDILNDALDKLTGIQAGVGALQERVEFAGNYLSSASVSLDAARGALADTDIAAEATNMALAQVQAQAAISVIAQTNALQSSLLTLLQNNS